MPIRRIALAACALVLLAGCGREDTVSHVAAPGPDLSGKQRALELGAALIQDTPPVGALNVYVNGFHFVSGDLATQVEAHHYCSTLSEDVRQCIIFDGNGGDAKLMGIEYIVSRRVFEQMDALERRLWHSHVYEVKSGSLVAPGVPAAAEHEVMEKMVGTYGKTWHTWHSSHDASLPLGHPMLMAGFTADGQLDPRLLAARDERLKLASTDRRRQREDIAAPVVAGGADAWQRGEAWQLMLQPVTATPTPADKAEADQADADRDETVISPPRRNRMSRSADVYAGLEPTARE